MRWLDGAGLQSAKVTPGWQLGWLKDACRMVGRLEGCRMHLLQSDVKLQEV